MDIIVREYFRVVWQKKFFFLLALLALASATFLDFYTVVFYKEIANDLASPFSNETLNSLLHSLGMIATFYAGIWLSWRFLEVAIIPLDGGGVNFNPTLGDGCNTDSQCSTMCDSYCPTAYNSDWYNNWYSCSGLR